MPVDASTLVALGDLTAIPIHPARQDRPLRRRPGPTTLTRPSARTAALAALSVVAGLVCGLALPAPAEAGPGASVREPSRQVTASAQALLTPSRSPFAGPTVQPARATGAAVPTAVVVAGSASPGRLPQPAEVPAYTPTRPLPAHSGTGRRIVYAERAAHVWVVDASGTVLRDYPVTGRVGRPRPGLYHVYSKSRVAVNPGERLRFEYMVRFAYGLTGARIGFHTIPRYADGVAIQSESQLGRATGSGGCVRQARADAVWLYEWSRTGDRVIVLA